MPLPTPPVEYTPLNGISSIAIGEISGRKGEGLSDDLTEELIKTGIFDVMDREHTEEILQEQELQMEGVIDGSTAGQLGELIGADALILGKISTYKYKDNKLPIKRVLKQCLELPVNREFCPYYYKYLTC